jgi:hypothetical protein
MTCGVAIAALTESDVHSAVDDLTRRSKEMECLGIELVLAAS